jgi:hypothetical protein
LALIEVRDDHRLADLEPLRRMLEACEGINKRPQRDFRCGRGNVPVLKEVTELCRTAWDISGVVAMAAQGWRLVEVWNVSP